MAAVAGTPMVLLAGVVLLVWPDTGYLPVLAAALGLPALALVTRWLGRYAWLAPWALIVVFCTSDELRLRLTPAVGVAKDALVLAAAAALVLAAAEDRRLLHRLRPLGAPLAAFGLVVALYLANPAGQHGANWFYGTRLLVEVLVLLLVGLLCADPAATLRQLVRVMTVLVPAEAAFAWLQQFLGSAALTAGWVYQFGAQVRVTSDGGLRTSGTFDDPFQLAALAVLGTVLALFAASRRQAWVLLTGSVAILAATSVRTAMVQVGILLLLYAVRRGQRHQVVALGTATAMLGIFMLASTTASVLPGAPAESQLLTLNGRTTAWQQAVTDLPSLVMGNGVGVLGIGSSRAGQDLISAPPAAAPGPDSALAPIEPGNSAFLDSSYAQVQSDVGIIGTLGLAVGAAALAVVLGRACARARDGATWAAFALLLVSMLDWMGRSSLASYTTGFLTMYVLGVLIAARQPAPVSAPGTTEAGTVTIGDRRAR